MHFIPDQYTRRSLFVLLMMLSAIRTYAQDGSLPQELKPFVLKGYEMLAYAEGDLNGDKKKDAILILKVLGEDTVMDEVKRPLLLLIRQPNGKLTLLKRSDELVMCSKCGGMLGDPYENLAIEKNGFVLNFYGGASDRWGYEYHFAYKPQKHNWFLIKQHEVSINQLNEEITTKECDIDEEELGEVPIEKFNSTYPGIETTWKVTAAKAYFYDSPKKTSKPRKAYLLKGDTLTSYRSFTNFVDVYFENKKEQSTSGFILRSDLQQVK